MTDQEEAQARALMERLEHDGLVDEASGLVTIGAITATVDLMDEERREERRRKLRGGR